MNGLLRKWIQEGREDVRMSTLAEDAFDRPPTADERRLMEGMMAEWHAADLADVGVYEDRLQGPKVAHLMAIFGAHMGPPWVHLSPIVERCLI